MRDLTIRGKPEEIELPEEKTLPEFIFKCIENNTQQGREWKLEDSITQEVLSQAQIGERSKSIASYLYKQGFRSGDVLIFLSADLVKLPAIHVGIWRANGISRASYPEDDEQSILHRVEECRVGWIYCDPPQAEMCLSIANSVYWDVEVIVNGTFEGCTSIHDVLEDDGTAVPEYDRTGEDVAVIMSTSGTTGMSKGACLSHEAILWTLTCLKHFPHNPDGSNLLICKGTHISGFLFPMVGMRLGYYQVVMHTVTLDLVLQAIGNYQPEVIFGFPAIVVGAACHTSAADYGVICIRQLICGGAPVTAAIKNLLQRHLPKLTEVFNLYGLTEVVPVVCSVDCTIDSLPCQEIKDMPETALGKLCPNVLAQFRDLETDEVLGPNQKGELLVKSKGCFTEYFNNLKATEKSFVDDFFRTGDVGYYDEDEFIYIVDRAKEIFKYKGNHVSPTEIENLINQHPAVSEVSVIGVEDPEGWGHLPRAFCVMSDPSVTTEDIKNYANEKLADYKRLRGGVYFIKNLPKGKTGKVTRQLVEKIQVEESTENQGIIE